MRIPPPSSSCTARGSGGWCYARVAALLRARGHTVFTPTLTGQGERAHLLERRDQSFDPHRGRARRVPLRAARRRRARRTLVWRHGDHRRRRPHRRQGSRRSPISTRSFPRTGSRCSTSTFRPTRSVSRQCRRASAGSRVPAPSAAYFGVNAADAATVDALATPHPLGCFTEKLKLSGAYRSVQQASLRARHRAAARKSVPAVLRARKSSGWSAHALACGHRRDARQPEQTAALLETMANS